MKSEARTDAAGPSGYRSWPTTWRLAIVSVVLLSGLVIQINFLRNYPQPILFGDPGAYYIVGQKLQQAVAAIWEGTSWMEVLDSIRGYLYFVGVGLVYATFDLIRPHDIPFFRNVLAIINCLGMFGCFLLARRLSRSFAGGLVALTAAAVYPSFSVQTGRIFPEPVIGCLFVWSAFFFVKAVERSSVGWMFLAGLGLGAGFFIRAQLMSYFPVLLGAALLASAPWWLLCREHRRLVVALVISCLPFIVLWGIVVETVGEDLQEVESFGFWTFPAQQRYPYGFWMFLETDGWLGPYQLSNYPFYQTMQAEAADDPELSSSRVRQYAFTARYVASRFGESVLQLAENAYRLHARPANDYQWDYPFHRSVQSSFQKTIVVLAIAGIVTLAAGRAYVYGVFFVPVSVALVGTLGVTLARYNQPAMLILIAVAGGFLGWLPARLHRAHAPERKRVVVLGGMAVAGLVFLSLRPFVLNPLPDVARALDILAVLALVIVPFYAAHIVLPRGKHRLGLFLAWVSLTLVVIVHMARDRSWHQVKTELGGDIRGIEQEILLSAEALARLRNAVELFLVFDIHAPEGALHRAELEVNGRRYAGSLLVPAMPPFGESTTAGGRDPRRYRQWWALPLSYEDLPRAAPAVMDVKLFVPDGSTIVLYGDRFAAQQQRYEGPSFGDWPHLAALKLEYDGDYRIPVRTPLRSAGTRSFALDEHGGRTLLASVHRVRVLSLETRMGRLQWESEPIRVGLPSALFHGVSGVRA